MKIKRRILNGRKIVLTLCVFGLILGGFMIGQRIYHNPEKVAEREIKKMARDYYENHFYHQFVGKKGENGARLAKYQEHGLSPVLLRHLLSYDGAKYDNLRKYFDNKEIACDTEKSQVTIKPKEPFGRNDYEVLVFLYCKNL